MRPSRSHRHNWSVPGTGQRPTEFVNSKLVNATTADQLPEMDGATSGSTPSRNGPVEVRMAIPYGRAPAEKTKSPNNARTNNARHCAKNREYNLFTNKAGTRFSVRRAQSNFYAGL